MQVGYTIVRVGDVPVHNKADVGTQIGAAASVPPPAPPTAAPA